jgi:hypothetical protein
MSTSARRRSFVSLISLGFLGTLLAGVSAGGELAFGGLLDAGAARRSLRPDPMLESSSQGAAGASSPLTSEGIRVTMTSQYRMAERVFGSWLEFVASGKPVVNEPLQVRARWTLPDGTERAFVASGMTDAHGRYFVSRPVYQVGDHTIEVSQLTLDGKDVPVRDARRSMRILISLASEPALAVARTRHNARAPSFVRASVSQLVGVAAPSLCARGTTLTGGTVIAGSRNNDTLLGSVEGDVIHGYACDDFIEGEDGDDILDGGSGGDTLDGGPGADEVRGRDGDDWLHGGEGSDLLTGGPGDDTLDGGEGNDILVGGEGDDALFGGPGEDECYAGGGTADVFTSCELVGQ